VAGFDLQVVLPTDTADISNSCYKSKHVTFSCTFCNLQMEAVCDVQCYLWHAMRRNRRLCWNSLSCSMKYWVGWQLVVTAVILQCTCILITVGTIK